LPVDLRRKITQALLADPFLQTMVGDRVFQRMGVDELEVPPSVKPFIVYHFGSEIAGYPSALHGSERTFQVWVHDDPGDYWKIDQILDQAKIVLEAIEPENGLCEFRYFDKGPDLYDNVLKTIMRFSRFTATLTY
jgi:hypothetical protein